MNAYSIRYSFFVKVTYKNHEAKIERSFCRSMLSFDIIFTNLDVSIKI